ncbi:amino acid ABC transporter substrate-binding protein [Pediococcus argentinicus]|uniref:Solute-binding protein family 3/N-terminal domain-containing protein n=1 Tax=Pediococcus argentinicus TaxID=480391 RepID=A0A0R2NHM3_9LACO|nr:amino acid ABC transporter substrate-binding protein [Pediococcus argentinicus]KRO25288.1 hypothetical protein IV88_GL000324 [Pediococcus argentinicus]NKZ22355.1 amino acid ABC transporter substrate-binding protein [Pediococcus argentinicus]GEP19422.1 amino acid ABC transporter substrate-binding protein [Pediococcus argentinicus]
MKIKSKYSVYGLLLIAILLITTGCARVGAKQTNQDSWNRISKSKHVVIGIDDSFVPMDFREKNGTLVGYDVDLARAVFKQAGVKVDFQTIDWSMNATELRNQTIDLIWNGFTITPERKETMLFSQPYLKNEQILVTKTKSNIKSTKDMSGKTLGAQSGSSGSQDIARFPNVLQNRIKGKSPILYDSFNNAFIDLNANRIQGLLIDSVYAKYYISHQKNPSDYRIIQSGLPDEEFAIGMRKRDRKLNDYINSQLDRLQKNGTITKLNQKWFGDR